MNRFILGVLLTFAGAILITEASVCDPNPCKNSGSCQPPDQGYNWGYYCKCQPGYYGAQCQWDSDKCEANTTTPCQNNGKCVVTQDGRFCNCPGSTESHITYGGYYCEIVNPCLSCPSNTVYCQSAPTNVNGRLCLNAAHMVIH